MTKNDGMNLLEMWSMSRKEREARKREQEEAEKREINKKRTLAREEANKVKIDILNNMTQTGAAAKVNLDKTRGFIQMARSAKVRNDKPGLNRAMSMLKYHYGVYQCMNKLYYAYAAMYDKVDINCMTAQFAETIHRLKENPIPNENVKYDDLMRELRACFVEVNMDDLDKLMKELTTFGTEEALTTGENSFFEALVNGTAQLDTPYYEDEEQTAPEVMPAPVAQPAQPQPVNVPLTTKEMLDQINARGNK